MVKEAKKVIKRVKTVKKQKDEAQEDIKKETELKHKWEPVAKEEKKNNNFFAKAIDFFKF